MKPRQRLAQRMSLAAVAVLAVAALSACRKEVPPPPLPTPDEVPRPKVELTRYAATALLERSHA